MFATIMKQKMPSLSSARLIKLVSWFLISTIGYMGMCHLSIWLSPGATGAMPVWFADGLALGLYLIAMRRRKRRWARAGVASGVLVANLVYSYVGPDTWSTWTIWASMLCGSIINVLQTIVAGEALNAARLRSKHWLPVRRLAMFLLICVVLVNGLAAALSAAGATWTKHINFTEQFWTTFISDGLGIMLLVPLVNAWSRRWRSLHRKLLARLSFEVLLMLLGLTVATGWAYSRWPDAYGMTAPYFYVGLPFLLWSTIRMGTRATTLALLVYVLIAVYFTAHDQGPFVNGPISTASAILRLQEFLAVFIAAILVAQATLMERSALLRERLDLTRRYDAALRASDNLIFEIEQSNNHIVWAGDTRHVLGIAASDISIVSDWVSRIHPDDRLRVTGTRGKLLSGEWSTAVLEYRVRRSESERALQGSLDHKSAEQTDYATVGVNAFAHDTRLEDGSTERRVIGFVKEISEKKREDAERRKLEIELRQAQKMEAIGQLAGGIAHDFNNILAAIIGYGEMARNKVETGTPLARHLDAVLKAGERGRLLISQILTFSRRTPEKKQVVNIADLIHEVVMLLRGSSPHTIEFKRLPINGADQTDRDGHSRQAAPIHVLGSAIELHQLVMNLAINGLQAMSGVGTLSIDVGIVQEGAPKTVIQGQLPAGEYAVISIRDQGVGIDEATRSRMFEPFFTTKPAGQGTGLGLSLAMAIAKAHGGGIDVASRLGEGATFTAYLPMLDSRAEAGAGAEAIADPDEHPAGASDQQWARDHSSTNQPPFPRGHDQCVLLVDDEPALRELAAEILASLGYRSVSFATSEDALAAFEREPERFDAVLTDEVMPGLTGTQLATRIHMIQPAIPIFIITGYGGVGFELRAQQAGVARILRKPYEAQELAEVLANAFSITR